MVDVFIVNVGIYNILIYHIYQSHGSYGMAILNDMRNKNRKAPTQLFIAISQWTLPLHPKTLRARSPSDDELITGLGAFLGPMDLAQLTPCFQVKANPGEMLTSLGG